MKKESVDAGGEIEEAGAAAWRITYAPAPYPASDLERDAHVVALALPRLLSSLKRTPPSTAGWLPISTAPKDGRPVMLFTPTDEDGARNVPGGLVWISGGWGKAAINPDSWRGESSHGTPTLWMSIPAPSQEGASEGEGDWRNSIGDDGHQVSPPYRSDFPDDHTDPAYGSWFVPAPEQEGASEALGEPKASEHISPERRRGLEEAARLIEKKHTNNVGMVHPMAASDAAAIRALIPPSSEGGSPR
jgi:hypothetical protein